MVEVLRTKHLDARPLTVPSLNTYPDRPPDIVPLDITNNTVREVAGRLSGGSEPGETDSVILKYWLLRFGAARGELRLTLAEFAEWMGERAAPLGCLPSADERPDDHAGQAARGQSGRCGRNLAETHAGVHPEGDGAGSQGCLWDGAAGCNIRTGN